MGQNRLESLGIQPQSCHWGEMDRQMLNRCLEGLFSCRHTLVAQGSSSEAVLSALDLVLSYGLMEACNRRDLTQIMMEAQMLGWVDNGADILPLIEPQLRLTCESLKPDNPEKIAQIPLIGVVGKIASGKGILAESLSQQYDVAAFPFSERLRSIALAMGFHPPYTRHQLREINDIYKPTFGNQIFVEWTLILAAKRAASLHFPDLIVVDGFRSVEETEYFLNQPNTHLVAVIASRDEAEDRQLRYQRQLQRHRGHEDSATFERFMVDDGIESAWIDPVIKLAQDRGQIIYNNGSLEEFRRNIFQALAPILPPRPK
jgi:hypothetical protein